MKEENGQDIKIPGIQVRTMELADYEKVYALWKSIKGFGIRSIDDSKEGVEKFLLRNPGISVVAELEGEILGSILCGHDGRTASFYHVCVRTQYRRQGIGKRLVGEAMQRLRAEGINKISLVAFAHNTAGNEFWNEEGWTLRTDYNCYDFFLNEKNITRFMS